MERNILISSLFSGLIGMSIAISVTYLVYLMGIPFKDIGCCLISVAIASFFSAFFGRFFARFKHQQHK